MYYSLSRYLLPIMINWLGTHWPLCIECNDIHTIRTVCTQVLLLGWVGLVYRVYPKANIDPCLSPSLLLFSRNVGAPMGWPKSGTQKESIQSYFFRFFGYMVLICFVFSPSQRGNSMPLSDGTLKIRILGVKNLYAKHNFSGIFLSMTIPF